jgi:hypothetical protein
MRVPDEVRKCVGFVYYKSDRAVLEVAGTAFFVAVQPESEPGAEELFEYTITAKHVVDAVRENGADGKLYVRLNQLGGGLSMLVTEVDLWRVPPALNDEVIDVAVFRGGPPGGADRLRVHRSLFLTEQMERDFDVGVGDEVFVTGLFLNHYGDQRNIPVVRVGNIAAMREEYVQTDEGPMDAYLIEARSTGGLSGSPVFVSMGAMRTNPATKKLQALQEHQFFLLGLIRGHWSVVAPPGDGGREAGSRVRDEVVNMGIAIVTPTSKMVELIDDRSERAWRIEKWKNFRGRSSASAST